MACLYCGQSNTRLENGYCKKYGCETSRRQELEARGNYSMTPKMSTTITKTVITRNEYRFGRLSDSKTKILTDFKRYKGS